MYYWSKLYTSELKHGEAYQRLKKAVAINIVDFNIFDPETVKEWHSEVVAVRKGTQEIFSDKFHIHFYELRKLAKAKDVETIKTRTRQELWMQFLNARSEEDLEMLDENTNNEVIHKAVKVVFDLSEDTKLREWARMREKALKDEASALYDAREEGHAEGIEQERARGMAKMLQVLRASGMDEAAIQAVLNDYDT